MKKFLNYLMIIALMFAMNMAFVSAEENLNGNGEVDADVTVGNAPSAIYDVDIEWRNFVFDWEFDYNDTVYKWVNHKACTFAEEYFNLPILSIDPSEYEEYIQNHNFYSDSNCTQVINDKSEVDDLLSGKSSGVYFINDEAQVDVTDFSENGYVVPSLEWNSEDKYDYTVMTFKYANNACVENTNPTSNYRNYYVSSECTGEKVTPGEVEIGTRLYERVPELVSSNVQNGLQLPTTARMDLYSAGYYYRTFVNLGIDSTKTINRPTAGETIGTLTISIETY